MASKTNEAKITFRAETQEFTDNIKKSRDTIKNLNSDLKLADTQFKNGGDSVEYYSTKSQILQQQLSANADKQEALTQKIEVAKRMYGESSSEVDTLKTSLNYAQIEEENLAAKLADANTELVNATTAAASLTPEMQDLKESISKQETELGNLQTDYANAVTEFGAASDEAGALKEKIARLSSELSEDRESFDKLADAAGQMADDVGTASSDAIDAIKDIADSTAFSAVLDQFDSISEASDTVSGALETVVGGSVENANEMENATANVSAYFGETGEAAESTASIVQSIYEGGWGDSMDSCAEAVKVVKENFDNLNDTDLEALATQAVALEGMGVDMSESMRGVNNLMTQFGLSSTEAMDLYVAGINNGLNYTDELGDNVAEYSGAFADAGYSAEEYFQLLENGSNNGAYNLDKVNDAINEATTRIEDGTIEESLSQWSTGTQEVFQAFSNGSATEKDVIDSIVGDIQNTTDEQEKLNLMALAFGTMGEDGSQQFIESLSSVGDSFTDTEGAADQMTDTLSTDASDLEGNIRTIEDTFIPIASDMLEAFMPVIEKVAELAQGFADVVEKNPKLISLLTGVVGALAGFSGVGKIAGTVGNIATVFSRFSGMSGLSDIIKNIGGALKGCIKGIGSVLSGNPIGIIITAIGIVVPLLVTLYQNCEPFREFIDTLVEVLKGAFLGAIEKVKGAIEKVTGFISGIADALGTAIGAVKTFAKNVKEKFKNIKENIGEKCKGIKEKITGAFSDSSETSEEKLETLYTVSNVLTEKAKEVVGENFSGMKSTVKSVMKFMNADTGTKLEMIKDAFGTAGENIKSLFGGKFEKMKENILNIVGNLRDKIKGIIDKIKGFFDFDFGTPTIKLPHFSFSPKGWKIGDIIKSGTLPSIDIEWYGKGAVFSKPTVLPGVGDASSPEAVAPIDVLQGYVMDAVLAANTANAEIDYDKLGKAVAKNMPDMTMKLNEREIGRMVRSYA